MPRSSRSSGTRIRGCATWCRIRPSPAERVVENGFTRQSLFGLTGVFYQRSSDYPLPLLGLQYFDFDLFGKNKQLSVFFAGVLLFANYTDPALLGTRLDLGVDLFGQAIPFTEQAYRNGEEIVDERIKHLGEFGQLNLGLPIGTYLKTSLGLLRAVGQLSAGRRHGASLRDARGHTDHRSGGAARVEPGRVQPGRQGKLRLAGEVGGVGQSGHFRLQSRPENLLEVLGRAEQGLLLLQVPQARRRGLLPRRRPPGPVLAVGFRTFRHQQAGRLSRAGACAPTTPSWPTSPMESTSRSSCASASTTTRRW